MFAIFQTIAASLGYVNLSATIKSRVYTILASLGDFYLLYVAYRFYRNGFPVRGTLFILAFLAIAYFCYLNIVYYFTDQKAKYDVSPKIEETLHIESKDPLSEEEQAVANAGLGFVQTNGIFDKEQEFLPATLDISKTERANIQEVAQALIDVGFVTANYAGLTDKQIAKQSKNRDEEIYKLVRPMALPYFELVHEEDKFVIYGGLNQMRSAQLATVKTIGLLAADAALEKYDVYLATVLLTDGPSKKATRQGLDEFARPYGIDVKFAYHKKGTPAPKINPQDEKREHEDKLSQEALVGVGNEASQDEVKKIADDQTDDEIDKNNNQEEQMKKQSHLRRRDRHKR